MDSEDNNASIENNDHSDILITGENNGANQLFGDVKNILVDSYDIKIENLLSRCRMAVELSLLKRKGTLNERGAFFIDQTLVPVHVFQEGLLLSVMDPISVVTELSQACKWSFPQFLAIDYVPCDGFLCGVIVNGHEFLTHRRGRTPKLAKQLAAASFLEFLGFKIYFENINLANDWTPTCNFNPLSNRGQQNEDLRKKINRFKVNKYQYMRYRQLFLKNIKPKINNGSPGILYEKRKSLKRLYLAYSILKNRGELIPSRKTCTSNIDVLDTLLLSNHDYNYNSYSPKNELSTSTIKSRLGFKPESPSTVEKSQHNPLSDMRVPRLRLHRGVLSSGSPGRSEEQDLSLLNPISTNCSQGSSSNHCQVLSDTSPDMKDIKSVIVPKCKDSSDLPVQLGKRVWSESDQGRCSPGHQLGHCSRSIPVVLSFPKRSRNSLFTFQRTY